MNKLFLLLSFCAACLQSTAQTMLKVSLSDNSRINIALNGRYYNKQGTSITVGDLPPGRHHLKIFSMDRNRRGSAYERLVYQGTVRTSNGTITRFVYNSYSGMIDVQRQDINDPNGYAPTPNHPDDNQYRANYNDGRENARRDANTNNDTPPAYNDNVKTDMASASPPAGPAASPVSSDGESTLYESKSEKLKTKVAAQGTDTEKMTLLKESLKKEKITTFQVSYIMDWLMFESSRLDFAKWAYSITVDKEYFSDLSSKFTYKSSQEELEKFIRDRK